MLVAVAIAVPVAIAATAGSAGAKTRHPVACASKAAVAKLPLWKAGGVLHGDVNGDGKADTVSVRFDKWAPGRCAFYLRVATAKGDYTLKLGRLVGDLGKLQANEPIRSWPFRIPVVDAVVDLGGRGNLIALGDNEGAADSFVDFVGLSHGRLRVIHTSLDLGGSAMDMSRASCTRGASLRELGVYNVATRKHPNRWAYSRTAYRRQGWRFAAVARHTEYGSYKKMWRAANRAGFPNHPLLGCSLARNPSFG